MQLLGRHRHRGWGAKDGTSLSYRQQEDEDLDAFTAAGPVDGLYCHHHHHRHLAPHPYDRRKYLLNLVVIHPLRHQHHHHHDDVQAKEDPRPSAAAVVVVNATVAAVGPAVDFVVVVEYQARRWSW
jgi:hypothetical protein